MRTLIVLLLAGTASIRGAVQQQPPAPAGADASGAVEEACARAAAENRRVLVVWGADSESCRALDALLAKEAREKLLYEYDVVRVASTELELARKLGADVEHLGAPFLTVLDARGSTLAQQPAVALARDPRALLDFLTRHQAPYEKAGDVRARALRDASAAGKPLLLVFGAPW